MKKSCIVLSIVLLSLNPLAHGQVSTTGPGPDSYIGLKGINIGMGIAEIKGKLIPENGKNKSDNSGRRSYSYTPNEPFFADENINVKSVTVKTFQNNVEEVKVEFGKMDDIKVFQKFRETYGMFTDKPNLYQDVYYWAGNRVNLVYDYSENSSNPVAMFRANL